MVEVGINHRFYRKGNSELKGKGCQEIHGLNEGSVVGGGESIKRQALVNE